MADELFQTGEEFFIKRTYRTDLVDPDVDLEVSLYNQSTDELEDDSPSSDVTTEPVGSLFERQTVSMDSVEIEVELNSNGNYQAEFEEQVFDVSDSTQDVDAFVVFVYYESDVMGDTETSENLFFAGNLDQTYQLEQIDEFALRGSGVAID